MLGKITLLQSASMCWTIISPTAQNPPLARTCRANVGPATLKLDCWSIVGPMSANQQWRVANNSNHIHLHELLGHACPCRWYIIFGCLFIKKQRPLEYFFLKKLKLIKHFEYLTRALNMLVPSVERAIYELAHLNT